MSRFSFLHKKNTAPETPELSKLRTILRYLYIPLCFFNFWFIDYFFRYIYQGIGLTDQPDSIPRLFTLAWCLILTGIITILPGRIKKVSIVVLSVFYNLLVLVHCGLYSFGGKFFSFSDLIFAGDGAAFFHFEYIFIRKITIAACVLSVGFSVFCAFLAPRKLHPRWWARITVLILSLAMVLGGSTIIRRVEDRWFGDYVAVSWNSYQDYSDIYESFTEPNSCLMLTGLYQYTARNFWLASGADYLFGNGPEKRDAITEYCTSRPEHLDNEMTGLLKEKNLILIQLEAIDTWMITPESMPNLYALKSQSLDFVQHYTPLYLYGGTFNTEIMTNLGQIPPFYGSSTGVYEGNSYPISLANLFRQENYTVNSFHNSRGDVYARGTIHPNWGYSSYNSGQDMGMENIEFDSGLISGFEKMTEGDHFFSFVITYSGHGPYTDSAVSGVYYDRFAALYPDADTEFIHAMAHAYETDLFIGALVAQLEQAELMEDTVLAFYADHYNYYVLDDALIMKYKGISDSNLIKNTPFFIYSPTLEPQTVEKVTSSVDVLPTLVNLFDFPVDPRFYIGDDAFSSEGGYVIFEDNSWYDGETYYKAGDPETSDLITQRNQEIATRLYISNNILLTNYFSHIDAQLYQK